MYNDEKQEFAAMCLVLGGLISSIFIVHILDMFVSFGTALGIVYGIPSFIVAIWAARYLLTDNADDE